MLYKRHPVGNKQHLHPNSGPHYSSDDIPVNADKVELKDIKNIPLPNEIEDAPRIKHSKKGNSKFSLLNTFGNGLNKGKGLNIGNSLNIENIGIEEIVLLGVIFLLFQERVEDEFLLILLVYVLLSGK